MSYTVCRETHRLALHEDVAFFAVLRNIQAAHLLLVRYADAHDGVHDLEDDERHHNADDPGDDYGGDLALDNGAALDQSEFGATRAVERANVPGRAGREDPGENSAERSA